MVKCVLIISNLQHVNEISTYTEEVITGKMGFELSSLIPEYKPLTTIKSQQIFICSTILLSKNRSMVQVGMVVCISGRLRQKG